MDRHFLKREMIGMSLKYISGSVFILFLPFSGLFAKYGLLSIYLSYVIKGFQSKGKNFLGLPLNSQLDKGFLLFFVSAVISTIFSVSPYHSQKILFSRYFLYLFSFYAGLFFVENKREAKFFEFIFILSGIIIGLGGIVYYLKYNPARLFFSWNVNVDIGAFSTLYLPFTFKYLSQGNNPKIRILGILGFCLVAFSLLLNLSRGSYVSVFLGVFIFLLITKSKKEFWLFFVFVLISLIFWFFLRKHQAIDLDTWSYRLPYLKEGLKLFKSSPLIGKGLGCFEKLNFIIYAVGRQALHVENLYIEILAQSGLVGLAAFFYLFWGYFKEIICNLQSLELYQRAVFSSIISCLISGIFGSVILVGVTMPFLFWFLLGISMAEINPRHKNE